MSKKSEAMESAKSKKIDKKSERVLDEKALELTKKALIKKYGDIIPEFEEELYIETVSTGCMSLDLALGNGGMAYGRIYEVYGQPSGGKSTLAISVLIQAQKQGHKCLYLDAEHAIDPSLLRRYGVDMSNIDFIQAFDGESSIDALEQLIKSGFYKVAVIDSISALLPRDESVSDIDGKFIGTHARLVGKAVKRLTPIASENGVLVILINQLRYKIVTHGNPETCTGGQAVPYFCTGRISIKGGEAKDRRIVDPTTDKVIGHKMIFKVEKNKLALPWTSAEVNLIYGVGFDVYSEVLNMALDTGTIDRAGAWYKYKDVSFAQGEAKAIEHLKLEENREMFEEIKNAVMDITGLKEEYEQHQQDKSESA